MIEKRERRAEERSHLLRFLNALPDSRAGPAFSATGRDLVIPWPGAPDRDRTHPDPESPARPETYPRKDLARHFQDPVAGYSL